MTVVSYPLGIPRAAESRGGDCRSRDLSQGRNVHGPHRFASTSHCRINNGLLRLTVGASGAVPALTVESRRGRVVIEDYLSDILTDTLEGSISTPEWLAMGTITIDSPSAAAVLTDVRLVWENAEVITIRLVAAAISDAFVTLKRGRSHADIQHGSTRPPLTDIDRRVRWTAAPSPVGTAYLGRVQEDVPKVEGFPRWVASIDPASVNAGAFSVVATSVTSARFGVGVATDTDWNRAHNQHGQMGDTSRPDLVITDV